MKDLNKTLSNGRKLLNVEKLVFYTGDHKEDKLVEVTAFRVGVPVKADLRELPVTYDIILEQLYGGLPASVWKVVFIVLVVLLIIIRFCLHPFINFVNVDNEKHE